MLSWNFTFAPPENWKSENLRFRPATGVLKSRPEWRDLLRHGGWDAGGETTRETENLEIWGGEPGGALRAPGKFLSRGGGSRFPELQVFRVS